MPPPEPPGKPIQRGICHKSQYLETAAPFEGAGRIRLLFFVYILAQPDRPPMSKTGKTPTPKDFESALTELEGLVARMESGQLPLEESLAAYKRGVALTAFCQEKLSAAEQQVKALEGDKLKPFQAELGDNGND